MIIVTPEIMMKDIIEESGISKEMILGTTGARRVVRYRQKLFYCLYHHFKWMTMRELGELTGKLPTSVSRVVCRAKESMEENSSFKKEIETYLSSIKENV